MDLSEERIHSAALVSVSSQERTTKLHPALETTYDNITSDFGPLPFLALLHPSKLVSEDIVKQLIPIWVRQISHRLDKGCLERTVLSEMCTVSFGSSREDYVLKLWS